MIEVIGYQSTFQSAWDEFLGAAKNSSFLFRRAYMEYHADRFEDASVMLWQEGKVVGLFPANRQGATVVSHGGLSYGGLVIGLQARLPETLALFEALLQYYSSQGIETLIYKQLPSFYHRQPCGEEDYALFLADAKLIRRDTNSVLLLQDRLPYQERRRRSIKKAQKAGLRVSLGNAYTTFWDHILTPNLLERHKLKPVHSCDEMLQLAACFPEQIQLWEVWKGAELVAGTLLFLNHPVVHAQYIGANETGKETGALDLLFDHLIEVAYRDWRYLSFGVSTEQQGLYLNQGLNDWKEGFGARTWVHHFYEVPTANVDKIRTVAQFKS